MSSFSIIKGNYGNNAFSYEGRTQRKQSNLELIIPKKCILEKKGQIKEGTEIVFEEIDHTNTLRSHSGLAYQYQNEKTFVCDNHNYCLQFRLQQIKKNKTIKTIVHIDQHSDMAKTAPPLTEEILSSDFQIEKYMYTKTNIGNFISPVLDYYTDISFVWMKSEQQFLDWDIGSITGEFILDIDCDFWAPEMSPQWKKETLKKTKLLHQQSACTTIATSPFFINQKEAIEIANEIL